MKLSVLIALLSASKDGCVSLHFTGVFVAAVILWRKRAVKKATRSVDSLPSFVVRELQLYLPTLIITILLPFYSWPRARNFRSQAL